MNQANTHFWRRLSLFSILLLGLSFSVSCLPPEEACGENEGLSTESSTCTGNQDDDANNDESGSEVKVTQIDAAYLTSCALLSSGTLKCWGENASGKLGNGSSTISETGESTPQAVVEIDNVKKVSAGRSFTCALKHDNSLFCWGSNRFGQLAIEENISTYNPNSKPILIEELGNDVEDVSLGSSHACVLTKSKKVKCWGNNYHGQLGNSDNTKTSNPTLVPATVTGLSDVKSIAAGMAHTCVIDGDGVKCFGNTTLGNNGTPIPTLVAGTENIVKLSEGGNSHICGINNNGGVICWGINGVGQTGNGNQVSPQDAPQVVTGLELPAISVSTSNGHSCAVLSDFTVWCWGANTHGQMGTKGGLQLKPQQVTHLEEGAVSVTSGLHNCVLTRKNGVKCWGFNRMGQVGNGSYSEAVTTPVKVDLK